MNDDLKDILSNLNPDIDPETLLLYLQGKLSVEHQHEVEKQMMETDFTTDALEGLEDFKDKRNLATLVDQLNKDLKKRTEKKKRFKEKMKIGIDRWVVVAVIIVLALAIISYILVHRQLMHHP